MMLCQKLRTLKVNDKGKREIMSTTTFCDATCERARAKRTRLGTWDYFLFNAHRLLTSAIYSVHYCDTIPCLSRAFSATIIRCNSQWCFHSTGIVTAAAIVSITSTHYVVHL
uniref:Uncharacterized protein n=1 Tax=Parascaris univalens TaxID=6257 RepID=A0A915ALX8_PARUN